MTGNLRRAFLCGWRPSSGLSIPDLTKAERKVLKHFDQYLRGEGHRCPLCLHKDTKHGVRCEAKGCECQLSSGDVIGVRAQAKAPGWEVD